MTLVEIVYSLEDPGTGEIFADHVKTRIAEEMICEEYPEDTAREIMEKRAALNLSGYFPEMLMTIHSPEEIEGTYVVELSLSVYIEARKLA